MWRRRLYRFRGFFNYLCSFLLLRYTPINDFLLRRYFHSLPVDRLHAGCGLTILPGWCNVLYDRDQEYGRVKTINEANCLNYDLLKQWPWPENSISFIAGAHFIEHLDLNQCIRFSEGSFRALRPGGTIRLSCPDLETYARNYLQGNKSFFENEEIRKACTFKTALTPSQIFAAKAYDSGGAHKWFHDFSSLKSVLERTGFVNVRKVRRLEGKTPDLERLEHPQREIETIYVEAMKPE